MEMNNFSTVPCTIEGSVEIGQAWLSSHFLFTLMESLFSSMSPSLLGVMPSHGYNWNFPLKSKWENPPGSSGNMTSATSTSKGTAQLERSEKVQKIKIITSSCCRVLPTHTHTFISSLVRRGSAAYHHIPSLCWS